MNLMGTDKKTLNFNYATCLVARRAATTHHFLLPLVFIRLFQVGHGRKLYHYSPLNNNIMQHIIFETDQCFFDLIPDFIQAINFLCPDVSVSSDATLHNILYIQISYEYLIKYLPAIVTIVNNRFSIHEFLFYCE